jgi:bifunctional DNA-binding transcriptional regulator/antitoxin component of YhaV-PrlF toxin-antitoxin module
MIHVITLQTIDGELALVFPDEVLNRLNVGEGDVLVGVVHEKGIMLRRADPSTKDAMESYRRGAEKYRSALRELAEPAPRTDSADESQGRE